MKIISVVHQLLFIKTTDLHTLDAMLWKNILSSYKSREKNILKLKLKYYQHRKNRITGISLEIILIVFEYLVVSLSFISVSILCEFAMLPDVYILLSPEEEEVHSSCLLLH